MSLKHLKILHINVQYNNETHAIAAIRNELYDTIKKTLCIEPEDLILEKYDEATKSYAQVKFKALEDHWTVRARPSVSSHSTISPDEYVLELEKKIEDHKLLSGGDYEFIKQLLQHSKKRKPVGQNGFLNAKHVRTADKPATSERGVQTKSSAYELDEYIEHMKNNSDDSDDIDVMMRVTYSFRRALILNKAKVSLIKTVYPRLFCIDQVEKEFEHTFNLKNTSLKKLFFRNLKKYSPHIMKYAINTPFVANTLSIMKKAESQVASRTNYPLQGGGALLCLPHALGQTFEEVIFFDKNQQYKTIDTPVVSCNTSLERALLGEGKFTLYVEGVRLCETEDIRRIFFALFASFYVFNIVFTGSCSQALMVLHMLFLEQEPYETDIEYCTTTVRRYITFLKSKV